MTQADQTQQILSDFFDQYAAEFNSMLADAAANTDMTRFFAAYVVEASPGGVVGIANDDQLGKLLGEGFAFQRSLGLKSMQIRNVNAIPIDELHAMARVDWRGDYLRNSDGANVVIDFTVNYFVQLNEPMPQVFAFVAGDEQAALRDHGLI